MTLVSGLVPALISGVSQQGQPLRLLSQVGEQINGHSSEVDGLRKRSPLEWKVRLPVGANPAAGAAVHTSKFSDGTPFTMIVDLSGNLFVYLLDGTPVTLDAPPAGTTPLSYLAAGVGTSASVDRLRFLTIGDTTFITNRTVKTAIDATSAYPARAKEALAVIRQGSYGKTYSITLIKAGGTPHTVSFQTPDGTHTSDVNQVGTGYICTQLFNLLTGGPSSGALFIEGFRFTNLGSIIAVQLLAVSASVYVDFTITCTDDFSNNGLVAFKGRTQNFSSLPSLAPNGFEIAVVGDDTSTYEEYYVKFIKLSPDDSIGVWEEVPGQGTLTAYDYTTMPIEVKRTGTTTVQPSQPAFATRPAGDITSIPQPGFVGRAITNMFLFKNRLGFLAGDAIVMSSAGNLLNFWQPTVTQVLDDAPIDISAADNASDISAASQYGGFLILWAKDKQIQLTTSDILTPRSVALAGLTNYRVSPLADPVVVGNEAYFLKDGTLSSKLQSFHYQQYGNSFQADDVTISCPSYIQPDVHTLIGSSMANCVAMLSAETPDTIFIYKFLFDGGNKLQSAVYKWTFEGASILGASFDGSVMNLVYTLGDVTNGYRVHFGTMELADGYNDGLVANDSLTHLDYRVQSTSVLSATFLPEAGGLPARTQILLPFPTTATTAIVSSSLDSEPGEVAAVVGYSADVGNNYSVTVAGDWTGRSYWAGNIFTFLTELSTFYLRRQNSAGASVATLDGRLMLRYVTLSHTGSGPFTVQVTQHANSGSPRIYNHTSTPRSLGDTSTDVTGVGRSSTFRFPVMGQNTETKLVIIESSHTPAKFQTLSWEGDYTNRSRGV